MSKILSEKQSGLFIEPAKVTVADYLVWWLKGTVRSSSARNTYDNYTIIANKHISPALGGIYLAKLTPQHLQRFYREKRDEGLPRTVRLCHAVIHRAGPGPHFQLPPRIEGDCTNSSPTVAAPPCAEPRSAADSPTPPADWPRPAPRKTGSYPIGTMKKTLRDLRIDERELRFPGHQRTAATRAPAHEPPPPGPTKYWDMDR